MNRDLASALHKLSLMVSLVLAQGATPLAPAAMADTKLKPEEIVARHLASIGSAEARSAIRSQTIVGTCHVTSRGRGVGTTDGIAVLASEGVKNLIGMKFAATDYPHEKIGYDGKNLSVSYVKPGLRSTLGDFLLQHEMVFKQGLVGGALSSSWPLLNLAAKEVKLEYAGTKKIGGKPLHLIKYLPRKGSDLQINLYFDTETFRHVRTQYDRVVAPNMGSNVDTSSSQRETRYQMIEEFSDFKQENGLDLPHSYNLKLSIDAPVGTVEFNWIMNLQKFSFNNPIDINDFNVNSY